MEKRLAAPSEKTFLLFSCSPESIKKDGFFSRLSRQARPRLRLAQVGDDDETVVCCSTQQGGEERRGGARRGARPR